MEELPTFELIVYHGRNSALVEIDSVLVRTAGTGLATFIELKDPLGLSRQGVGRAVDLE